MADQDGGTPRCTACGSALQPGAAICGLCGGAGRAVGAGPDRGPSPGPEPGPGDTTPMAGDTTPMAPVPGAAGPPGPGPGAGAGPGPAWPPPPPNVRVGGPPGPPTPPAGTRSPEGAARAWGAVSIAFGALVLVGSVVPWFADTSFALTDDLASAWPVLVIGVVGVLGGMDGLRGSLSGPALAAGAGSVFVLIQVVLLRLVSDLPGLDLGGGGVAWTFAAVAAVVLAVAVLSLIRADRARGTAPGWLGAVVVVFAAVWVVGAIVPPLPGLSLADHVEFGLFGGDAFSDVMTVAFIGVPAALAVVAAATRSRAAHGLAAGCMAYWTAAAVAAAAGYGASGDGTVRYTYGHFWPMLLGALGVAVAGCALLLPEPKPGSLPGERRLVPLAPAVGVALLPLAGIVGVVQYAEDEDRFTFAAEGEAVDVPEDETFGDTDLDDPGGADLGDEPGGSPGGSVDVVCTGLVDSTLGEAWQDVDGAIHVVLYVDNGCEADQQLDDPSASFTLTSGGAIVADATFDFSSRPVVVPAFGTSEAEIVFGPETFVDLGAVETLGLGGDAGTAFDPGPLGLTYDYTCHDASSATAGGAMAGPVTGEATDTPVLPETTSEDDALARLGEIAAADQPFVESAVIDRWVPQISSKRPYVPLPDGTVWDAQSILEDHRAWRAQFPRVRLLWSGDYSTFELADYWVTIVAIPFDTPEGALAWCDAQALPGEDCYAKLISHTHPTDDSTRHR